MALNVGVFIKKEVLILRLKGELDEVSVSSLRAKISNYIDDYKIKHLVLNLEYLDFMDSSGIGFIIGRYHQLKRANGDVTLCCLNNKVEKIIKFSGLAKICIIRESEHSVMVALGGK